MSVFDEIKAERQRQKDKWGGAAHDDHHSTWDWIVFITKHNGLAMEPGSQERLDIPSYRYQMVRVAALAVAAIEWCDRNYPVQNDPNEE